MTELQRQRVGSYIATRLERYELTCAGCGHMIWPESGPFTVVIEPAGGFAVYGACGVPDHVNPDYCDVWDNGGTRE